MSQSMPAFGYRLFKVLLLASTIAVPAGVGAQGAESWMGPRGEYIRRDDRGMAKPRIEQICSYLGVLGRDDLLDAEAVAAARVMGTGVDSIAAWRDLSCVRALVWANDLRSRPGEPFMYLGTHWATGTWRSLEQLLTREPDDSIGIRVLAAFINETARTSRHIGNPAYGGLRGTVEPIGPLRLLKEAVVRGVDDPVAVRACSGIAMYEKMWREGRICSLRGLVLGQDSIWHSLRMAYASFKERRDQAGLLWFRQAALRATDPGDRVEVMWPLQRRKGGFFEDSDPFAIDSGERHRLISTGQREFVEWVESRMVEMVERYDTPWWSLPSIMGAIGHARGIFVVCNPIVTDRGIVSPCHPAPSLELTEQPLKLTVANRRVWGDGGTVMLLLPYQVECRGTAGTMELVQGGAVDAFGRVDSRQTVAAGRNESCDGLLSFESTPATLHLAGAFQIGDRRTTLAYDFLPGMRNGPLALSDLLVGPLDSPWQWEGRVRAIPCGRNYRSIVARQYSSHGRRGVQRMLKRCGSSRSTG